MCWSEVCELWIPSQIVVHVAVTVWWSSHVPDFIIKFYKFSNDLILPL